MRQLLAILLFLPTSGGFTGRMILSAGRTHNLQQAARRGIHWLRSRRRTLATSAAATANGDGESFYQRLNSPKSVLAPMVAQSDLPFRLMCEQLYNVGEHCW